MRSLEMRVLRWLVHRELKAGPSKEGESLLEELDEAIDVEEIEESVRLNRIEELASKAAGEEDEGTLPTVQGRPMKEKRTRERRRRQEG